RALVERPLLAVGCAEVEARALRADAAAEPCRHAVLPNSTAVGPFRFRGGRATVTAMTDDVFERGMAIRKAVLGEEHVARAQANATPFDADFQRFVTETAWGSVWSRPGLDRRTRHLLTLAILAALDKRDEFAMHVGAMARTGVNEEDLREALLHVALYA